VNALQSYRGDRGQVRFRLVEILAVAALGTGIAAQTGGSSDRLRIEESGSRS
jgi:hypothetical protein